MAKRGRPRKNPPLGSIEVIKTKVDHAKVLKQFEQEQKVQLETLYKDLAIIKKKVDYALTSIGFIDDAETIAQASFKAGRAYGPLDEVNDRLEEILEGIYSNTDLDHYDDIFEN